MRSKLKRRISYQWMKAAVRPREGGRRKTGSWHRAAHMHACARLVDPCKAPKANLTPSPSPVEVSQHDDELG